MTDISVKKKKAIVVDDIYDTRTIITNFLKSNGYDVSAFKFPDEINIPIEDCDTIFMDVRFSKAHPELGKINMPYGGLDYIIEQIEANKINMERTNVFIYTRWDQNLPEVKARLDKIKGNYRYINYKDGLDFVELKKLLDETNGCDKGDKQR